MQLVWFRNDLRTLDHSGLTAAVASGDPVIGLFVMTEGQWSQQYMADCKRHLIYAQVADLSVQLAELNIPLLIDFADNYADSLVCVVKRCKQYSTRQIHFCYEYELNEARRDQQLIAALQEAEIQARGYHDSVIFPPGQIVKPDGTPYSMFTPFKKKWLAKLMQQLPACLARVKPLPAQPLTASPPPEYEHNALWPAGEQTVLHRLRQFCRTQVALYNEQRDFAGLDTTSRLSPYLSIGVISPRQALNRLLAEQGDAVFASDTGAALWLSELIWREFYRHLSYFYPELSKGASVKPKYERLHWRNDDGEFKAWCDGQTGYPIVDAAMRQLNQTGWMHNRLRMISASFLVKDLQVDWRWGERYFMQQLIDGDYAANNGGWQWCASTGHDAAPYFRIFNPTTQSERFDKAGRFIRKYCPELSDVPDKYVHQPHFYSSKFDITLQYPKPIVEHKQAREATLAMYRAIE
ncbi:MAG: deoxyribodipyrimidine photo-lyase [Pseudomonadales bacterium]